MQPSLFGEAPNWMKSLLWFTLLYIDFFFFLYISKMTLHWKCMSFYELFDIVVYEAIKNQSLYSLVPPRLHPVWLCPPVCQSDFSGAANNHHMVIFFQIRSHNHSHTIQCLQLTSCVFLDCGRKTKRTQNLAVRRQRQPQCYHVVPLSFFTLVRVSWKVAHIIYV